MTPGHSLSQLRELLAMARELGFADDVAHWEQMIANHEDGAK